VNQANEIPHLKAVQASPVLCRPLYVRAMESLAKKPALRDPKAVEIVKRLGLDAAIMEGSLLNSHVILSRTLIIDHAVKNFSVKKAGIIINLGVGLDTRVVRLGNAQTRWYEVDIPEIMAFRRAFISESAQVRFIAKPLLDEIWLNELAHWEDQTPILIIAEGLLSYFTMAETRQLLNLLAERFPGAQMYCDVVDGSLVARGPAPVFKWGLTKAKEIEQLHPKLQLVEHWSIKDFEVNRKQLLTYLISLLKAPAQKRLQVLRVRFKS
jgi:O-methyltransferase involved in polyketide biosynthesis